MKGRCKDHTPNRNRAAARLGARGVDAPKPDPPAVPTSASQKQPAMNLTG